MMQAIVQDRYGSAAVLEARNIDRPVIGDDEVLVRVRAAGVNPAARTSTRTARPRAPTS